MDIALLNARITFQKNTVSVDAIGNHLNTWADYFSCSATLGGESGSEANTAGLTVEDARLSFTVRWCSETAVITTTGFRVIWNDELYNITAIDHQNNKHKSLKFWCEKVRR